MIELIQNFCWFKKKIIKIGNLEQYVYNFELSKKEIFYKTNNINKIF